jgi:hypothetical protein
VQVIHVHLQIATPSLPFALFYQQDYLLIGIMNEMAHHRQEKE